MRLAGRSGKQGLGLWNPTSLFCFLVGNLQHVPHSANNTQCMAALISMLSSSGRNNNNNTVIYMMHGKDLFLWLVFESRVLFHPIIKGKKRANE
jgi:hypothetical protein